MDGEKSRWTGHEPGRAERDREEGELFLQDLRHHLFHYSVQLILFLQNTYVTQKRLITLHAIYWTLQTRSSQCRASWNPPCEYK